MSTFRVLLVCTGNVCRSPLAERLFRAGLHDRTDGWTGVEFTSAGTGALDGEDMTEPTRELVLRYGGDPEGFVSRQLDARLMGESDLVLTATRQHRSVVVALHPPAVQLTFTLRELARLAAQVDPTELPHARPAERLRALVTCATALRGQRVVDHPGRDDIIDPIGQGAEVYERCAAQIVPAVTDLLDLMLLRGLAPIPRS